MSFDLLAEFGSPSQPPAPQQQRPPQHQQPARPLPPGAPQPGTQRFSLFDDLAGLSQTAPPAAPSSAPLNLNAFSGGAGQFGPQGARLTHPTPAAPTSTSTPPRASSDDDWGDFADASTPAQPASLAPSINTPSQAPDPWASLRASTSLTGSTAPPGAARSPAPPSAKPANVPKSDPFDLSAWGIPGGTPQKSTIQTSVAPPQPPPSKPLAARDPSVLFDAENLSEDDEEFGDFEGGEPAASQTAPAPALAPAQPPKPAQQPPASARPLNIDNLLGELEVSDPLTEAAPSSKQKNWQANTAAKFAAQPKAAFGATQSYSAKVTPKAPASQAKPNIGWDDDWDDLTPAPAASSALQTSQATPSSSIPSGINVPTPLASLPDPGPNSLPPTNIPPPALLLALFPTIFSSAQASFFRPLSTQPTHVRSKILTDEAVIRFLRGYLAVTVVAARVIAGRKLRWKRDNFLAQGMRIGPAGKAGAGGMKLTAIDRAESTKEDREAADVVRAWKEQIGRLRSVVAQVNSSSAASRDRGKDLGSVPEIAETMAIRTAKELEGGVAAPKPCALCGLKRNERINKVDVDVEDSFGEWWVDQLSMHRSCRNFWEEHKEKLRY